MKNPVELNIIAFNTPYPPDFGGSIDVFYKLKNLAALGARIYLHCFTYKTFTPQPELERYCKKVFYYRRKKGLFHFFSALPYIVTTRSHPEMLQVLKESGSPILFEGLHTCRWLGHDILSGVIKIVRMHNIEHHYYRELCRATTNPLKKMFYGLESLKLKRFEKITSFADSIAAISPPDHEYFEKKHRNSILVPAFHPFSDVTGKTGTGSYFLFHGNLSVEENQKVVEFLANKVFNGMDLPLVIAGKNPPDKIVKLGHKYPNIIVRSNPPESEMSRLISDAQACIIPAFQATGLKLKLLGSLFAGRFCVVNKKMVSGTGLEDLCIVAESSDEFRMILKKIRNREFSENEIRKREKILSDIYSNKKNAEILLNCIKTMQA